MGHSVTGARLCHWSRVRRPVMCAATCHEGWAAGVRSVTRALWPARVLALSRVRALPRPWYQSTVVQSTFAFDGIEIIVCVGSSAGGGRSQ
jgi:hypothetical protein